MEREASRAQRQRLLQEKARAKQALLDASAEAADAHARMIELLTGAHRVKFVRKDWSAVASATPPSAPPERSSHHEWTAKAALTQYTPGWFARTFGIAGRKRVRLEAEIEAARARDTKAHMVACEDVARRRGEIVFAKSLFAADMNVIVAAINGHADLNDAPVDGVSILKIGSRLVALVDALELEDMPTQSVSLLQSGRASVKQLSKTRLLEIYRDNICSSAIRVAAEVLKAVPIDAIEVVMQPDLLDRGSGHITPQPVLYARITAQALSSVNLLSADATPLAERLGAHFDWSRRDGFRPIRPADFGLPQDLTSDCN